MGNKKANLIDKTAFPPQQQAGHAGDMALDTREPNSLCGMPPWIPLHSPLNRQFFFALVKTRPISKRCS